MHNNRCFALAALPSVQQHVRQARAGGKEEELTSIVDLCQLQVLLVEEDLACAQASVRVKIQQAHVFATKLALSKSRARGMQGRLHFTIKGEEFGHAVCWAFPHRHPGKVERQIDSVQHQGPSLDAHSMHSTLRRSPDASTVIYVAAHVATIRQQDEALEQAHLLSEAALRPDDERGQAHEDVEEAPAQSMVQWG